MTSYTKLLNKDNAVESIVNIAKSSDLKLEITEDHCFNNNWIDIGRIKFCREHNDVDDIVNHIKFGGFIWHIPQEIEVNKIITEIFSEKKYSTDENKEVHIKEIVKIIKDGLQDSIRRLCLLYPRFDTYSMGCFPLSKPTTVVSDTSAVRQGAVNFVCVFFAPNVRIKIPSTVHMEIINQADSYISQRQKGGKNLKGLASLLNSHVGSQGSQRALLNFELSSEIQVEKGISGDLQDVIVSSMFGNPKLNNHNSHRDRLIIESTKKLQFQKPQEDVYLLTSDQGMARIAMAEGLKVLFFTARNTPEVFGNKLPACIFSPYTSMFYHISLLDILWELAITFGAVQVKNDSDDKLQIWGIGGPGSDAGWQPFHVKEDLLWTVHNYSNDISPAEIKEKPIGEERKLIYYRFSGNKLIHLIQYLYNHNSTKTEKIQKHLQNNRVDDIRRYENFLESGDFISVKNKKITSKKSLKELFESLKECDIESAFSLFCNIPAFKTFIDFSQEKRRYNPDSNDLDIPKTSRAGYYMLGEILGKIYRTSEEIIVTDKIPELSNFINYAISAYEEVSKKNDSIDWVLTGEWLDYMAQEYSIHPIICRDLISNARESNLINIFFEGSTPDRRFDNCTLNVLSTNDNEVFIQKVFLYQGNFLLPGTATVRLKIQGGVS